MKQVNPLYSLVTSGKILFAVISGILLYDQIVGMKYKEDDTTRRLREARLI
jgi:hypothetical protein